MRVTAVPATPINVLLLAPYHSSMGVHRGLPVRVVEVETDDGITGVGTASTPYAQSGGPGE